MADSSEPASGQSTRAQSIRPLPYSVSRMIGLGNCEASVLLPIPSVPYTADTLAGLLNPSDDVQRHLLSS
jgi:hypothetical protein